MKEINVLLFGAQSSGKSSLLERFLFPERNPQVESTLGVDYRERAYEDFKLIFCDTPGDERYQYMVSIYMKKSQLGIYCIDLSKPFDGPKIERDIALFHENAGKEAPVILVATKSDAINKDTFSAFAALKPVGFSQAAIVSSKNRESPAALLTKLCEIARQYLLKASPSNSTEFPVYINAIDDAIKMSLSDNLLHTALVHLKQKMASLRDDKYRSIGNEACTLMQRLGQERDANKIPQIIDNFEKNCKRHLAGEHPTLKAIAKAVVVVAITAFVTVIAALVGFGIGFATGAWMGPAAFISGVVAGSTLAGLAVGALVAIGLFKASPVEKAMHEVARRAHDTYGVVGSSV
ncbi:MAG: GTP-binding protein [Legionella sp.]|nr:GTP-binding protein [Legionella sp.]